MQPIDAVVSKEHRIAHRKVCLAVGELVIYQHYLSHRGVVIDVDPVYMGTEASYAAMCQIQPPRDQPWYLLLVDDLEDPCYVPEDWLKPDPLPIPIKHPLIDCHFSGFDHGRYRIRRLH